MQVVSVSLPKKQHAAVLPVSAQDEKKSAIVMPFMSGAGARCQTMGFYTIKREMLEQTDVGRSRSGQGHDGELNACPELHDRDWRDWIWLETQVWV
jgi:hypothetical protein